MRNYQDPEEVTDRSPRGDETVLRHPAFAQIEISRVSGRRELYGSDFMHHNYVNIRLYSSELRRGLAHDWHYQRKVLAEFSMSEAQWATFVSSFSVGGGVPCTMDYFNGQMMPGFPLRDSGRQYKAEADDDLKKAQAEIQKTIDEVKAGIAGLSKKKQEEVLASLYRAQRSLESNLPFVAKSFDKHMEERVEKAKVEIEAHVTGLAMRAGIEALRNVSPLELAQPDTATPKLEPPETSEA